MTAPIYVEGERIVREAYEQHCRRQRSTVRYCWECIAALMLACAAVLTFVTLVALTAWSIKAVIG